MRATKLNTGLRLGGKMSCLAFLPVSGWRQDSLAPVTLAFLNLLRRLGKNRWVCVSKRPAQVIWEGALKGTLNWELLGQGGAGRGGKGKGGPSRCLYLHLCF